MSDASQPPHGRAVITAILHGDAIEACRIMKGDGSPEHAAYMQTYLLSALVIMVNAYATTLGMDRVALWQEECLKVERLLDEPLWGWNWTHGSAASKPTFDPWRTLWPWHRPTLKY